jgi:mannonate dehydratase
MEQTWRWFGPADPIPLSHVKQAGATGIVTALHHVPAGVPWSDAEVAARKREIGAAGLTWSVVESIPTPESIKLRTADCAAAIETWKASLRACARAGVKTVCYNFMPVVDWTRTDLMWRLPSTGHALRFDMTDFAAYDIFMLQRPGADTAFTPAIAAAAEQRFAAMSDDDRERLERTIIAGLPGADFSYDRAALRRLIDAYESTDAAALAANLTHFLSEVAPVAEAEGVQLGIHPDDPPIPLFGLPRVVSTASDLRRILHDVPIDASGLTFCVGSLGARADNPVVAMAQEFAPRIHFAHLRDVTREADGSFHEAEHLEGSNDMVGVIDTLLTEERRRAAEGHAQAVIPLRPDHGHLLGDDGAKRSNPGYSYVGRLKGLAEIRGVMRALDRQASQG